MPPFNKFSSKHFPAKHLSTSDRPSPSNPGSYPRNGRRRGNASNVHGGLLTYGPDGELCFPWQVTSLISSIHPTAPTAEDLRAGLDKLPQELEDIIYDMVFAAPTNVTYDIDDTTGKASPTNLETNLLAVSRSSREQYARSYYSGEGVVFLADFDTAVKWIKKLPRAHRGMIREMRFKSCFQFKYRHVDLLASWYQIELGSLFGAGNTVPNWHFVVDDEGVWRPLRD